MVLHCAVSGCSNGSYILSKWKKEVCALHACSHENAECTCIPPFKLFPFPTVKKNPEARKNWISLVNRLKPGSRTQSFNPSKDSRICSKHFVDGQPTAENPLPTLHLGYDSKRKVSLLTPPDLVRSRKIPRASVSQPSVCSSSATQNDSMPVHITFPPVSNDFDDPETPNEQINEPVCCNILTPTPALIETPLNMETTNEQLDNDLKIKNLERQNRMLKTANEKLKRTVGKLHNEIFLLKSKYKANINNKQKPANSRSNKSTASLFHNLITDDEKCLFYTNIPNIKMLNHIHDIIKPHVKRRFSLQPRKISTKISKHSPVKKGPERKLSSKDELLLTLMKIRLGLLFKDLGDRFGVTFGCASKIFSMLD